VRVSERSGGRRIVIVPPWFLSQSVRRQVEALIPNHYFRRMSVYFEKYGCIRCKRKFVVYCGCGLCEGCMGLVGDRLKRIDRKLESERGPDPRAPLKSLLLRRETARRLLADFRK
jgi:hypothetical protein